eukprot:7379332-Prymnesium_polylepis.1
MSMPGIGHWIRGHSTLVADTNNGVIVGDRFDMNLNAMLGRLYTDTSGPANTKNKIDEAVAREKKKAESSEKKRWGLQETLKTKNKMVQDSEGDVVKVVNGYTKKVRDQDDKARASVAEARRKAQDKRDDVENNDRLLDIEKQDKTEQIDEDLEAKIKDIEDRLRNRRATLDIAYKSSKGKIEGRLAERQSKAVEASDNLLQEQRKER